MIGIFREWNGEENGFYAAQKYSSQVNIVVINDDGFLPDHMVSPYRYYVEKEWGQFQSGVPLFADLLPIPDLWEITMFFDKAEIWDEGIKRADIEYAVPTGCHNTKTVRWMLPNGTIYKVDHYDKYGKLYYDELLDQKGEADLRTYYAGSKPVLTCQPKKHLFTLLKNGQITHVFSSGYLFIRFFIKEVFPTEMAIISPDEELARELEKTGLPCKWGNRFELSFPDNPCGKDAYILTNSDQVEHLEELIVHLPELHFHVGAITLMSDRLMCLKKYQNVTLYPGISTGKRTELLQKCSYYLDINHYGEICDAVYDAYKHSLLIVGFDSTLHNRAYVLPQCIFSVGEFDKMVSFLKGISEEKAELLNLVTLQNEQPLKNLV